MKKNLISSFLSLVMTSLLLIGVVVAWYTSNKEVSTSRISGVTSSEKLVTSLQHYNGESWVDTGNLELDEFAPGDSEYFRIVIQSAEAMSLNAGFKEITTSFAKDSHDNIVIGNDTTNFNVTKNGIAIFKYYKYHVSNMLFARSIASATATDSELNVLTATVSNGNSIVVKSGNTTISTISNIVVENSRITSLSVVDGSNNSCTYVLGPSGLTFKIISSLRETLANVSCVLTSGELIVGASQTLAISAYDSADAVSYTNTASTITIGSDVISLTTSNGVLSGVTSSNTNLKFKIDSDKLGFRIIDSSLSGVPGEPGKVLYYVGSEIALGDYSIDSKISMHNYPIFLTTTYTPNQLETGVTVSSTNYSFSSAKDLDEKMISNLSINGSGLYYLYFKISFNSSADDNYYQYQTLSIGMVYVEESEGE